MKQFLRGRAQAWGLYEPLAIGIAKLQGLFRGIRITRTAESHFGLRDRHGRKMFINRRHAVYLLDFVKYFSFYFDGVIPDANNEVHYENPGWHTPCRWGRPLYFTSFAESAEVMDIYLKHSGVKPGDVVFDLGAYCGLTALGFAEQVGKDGHVYTFEPDPENFVALKKNLETSTVTNVTAENAAIWKESGHLQLQAEGTVASMVLSLAPRTHSTIEAISITLADYLSSKNIDKISLIKLDVEGAEVEILASSREVLKKFRPVVIVEVHLVHGAMTTAACRAILEEEGYRIYEVPQPGTTSPLIVGKPANSA
jgi:FkbM family methyltransferase